ncbi:MAG: hypothetical protein JW818_11935 [Pirellulales bacterium]|nr:hypothetical protein [Pirellulales bacterium]
MVVTRVRLSLTFGLAVLFLFVLAASAPAEPPALNPFGAKPKTPTDARPGYVEMSDGQVTRGLVYLTRDVRLKIYDEKLRRQREVPLRAVKRIEAKVKREWNEREWRFKELAADEKYFTGRTYPAREYLYTITLTDGRTITGPLSAIVYVSPSGGYQPDIEPKRFLLHKRDKGEVGTELKSLLYVRRVVLGEEEKEGKE